MSTPTLEMAREYLARNMRVIPVPAGRKSPVLGGWQNLRLSEPDLAEHFSKNSNIGLLLGAASDGLVDVDLDCPEAERVAGYFLPQTKMWSGRENRPRSHAWFKCFGNVPGTTKYVDTRKPDGADHSTLVELRGTGGQTIVAPSRHPSGDVYIWAGSLDPAPMDGDELRRIVAKIGAAALLARYWLNSTRHDAALALAGMLLRAGWSQPDAATFVEAVATAAGDEEVRDRVRAVADTATRIEGGKGVIGASTLAMLIDEHVVKSVKEWLGLHGAAGADEHQTELGLCKRIVREHGAAIRYVWAWSSWLTWDGMRFRLNAEGKVWALAKAAVSPMLAEAIAVQNTVEHATAREKAIAYAMTCEKERTIRAALNLARSEPGITVEHDKLNDDTYLLNTPTGIVDLRDGSVRPHDPALLLTKLCPTPYEPNATAPTWERFLLRIFDGDLDLILFNQRLYGYAATGSCREHVLPIKWGSGANGKSTETTAILDTLGHDYAVPIAQDLLFAKTGNSHPTGIADLYGKRVAITHEMDAGTRLAEGLVKSLTGGDRIKARRMQEDFWAFTPTHTLFLGTNSKPVVRGIDDGIWRRLVLIPYQVTIPEAERDTRLGDKLRAEAPGILAWIVAGAIDWYQNGLNIPAKVSGATAAYRSASDVVGEFLAARCVLKPELKSAAKALYDEYLGWHQDNVGGDPLKQTTFGRNLGERGLTRLSKARPVAWQGVGLASEPLP